MRNTMTGKHESPNNMTRTAVKAVLFDVDSTLYSYPRKVFRKTWKQ